MVMAMEQSPAFKAGVRKTTIKHLEQVEVARASQDLPISRYWHNEPILLPYQKLYFETVRNNKVTVCIKSRRIGLSWGDACYSTLEAGRNGGSNQSYISYNRESAYQYIRDCEWWAKQFQMACSQISGDRLYTDEDKDLLVYRLKFASGNRIEALSSKPSNLRGKKGGVMLDEFCFHEKPEEMLRAVYALLIWGDSRIRIVSTPDAFDDAFAKLIGEIRAGERDFALLNFPLNLAVNQGLYQRICLINGLKWSQEKEVAWVKEIEDIYRPFHKVELYCQFVDFRSGGIFNKEDFVKITWEYYRAYWEELITEEVISFDLAATAKEMGDRRSGDDPFYTFGVHMAKTGDGKIFVLDIKYAQADAEFAEKLIVNWAQQKGNKVKVAIEEEPGSTGRLFINHMKRNLRGFRVVPCPPKGDKLTRARPFANTAANGLVHILPFTDHAKYLEALHRWSGKKEPFTSDAVDASTQAYSVLAKKPRVVPPGSRSMGF